jgi:hypothetical protein
MRLRAEKLANFFDRLAETQPETRRVSQRILRYIYVNGLRSGDRLPIQTELCLELNTCHNTLYSAMKILSRSGVVRRKRGAGTVVHDIDTSRMPLGIWRVGVAWFEGYTGGFFYAVSHYLREYLHRAGCQDDTYLLTTDRAVSPTNYHKIEEFGGLVRDVDAGLLDGVITTTWLKSDRIPVCHVGGWPGADLAVAVDHADVIHRACRLLSEKGARKIEAVMPNALATTDNSLPLGRSGESQEPLKTRLIEPGVESGLRLANELVSLDHRDRPDGIVIVDDNTATAFSYALLGLGASRTEGYRPMLAAMTNKQAEVTFAWPSFCFEVDAEALAKEGVDLLVSKMLSGDRDREIRHISPQLKSMS